MIKKSDEQVIKELRKVREKLWAEKMAAPAQFERKIKWRKMTKRDAKEALKHFEKLREMIAQRPSQFQGMTEKEFIQKMRQTREELWKEKIGAGTRF